MGPSLQGEAQCMTRPRLWLYLLFILLLLGGVSSRQTVSNWPGCCFWHIGKKWALVSCLVSLACICHISHFNVMWEETLKVRTKVCVWWTKHLIQVTLPEVAGVLASPDLKKSIWVTSDKICWDNFAACGCGFCKKKKYTHIYMNWNENIRNIEKEQTFKL